MEESLIKNEEIKKQKDNNKKKSSLFCCCFGSNVDQETDDENNDNNMGNNEGNLNNQDMNMNMNTAIPNSSFTNQESDIVVNGGSTSSKEKSKKSPKKVNKKEKENTQNNSNTIKEQREENNSCNSSGQQQNAQTNQSNQIQSQTKNQMTVLGRNNSNKKQNDYYDEIQRDGQYGNDASISNHLESNSQIRIGGKNIKKHKYNIKTYFQQIHIQPNDLFHLYSKNEENYILVKLLEKNFQCNSLVGSQINVQQAKQSMNQKSILSSTMQTDQNSFFYNKNFKSDFDSQYHAIPEPICQYLASRLRHQIVIDAFCGVGYNTVQFAKEAHQVIAIDVNQVKISHAKYNIEQFKSLHKVEVIQSDFLQMKKLKGDVVILHPDYKKIEPSSNEDIIELLQDVSPNLIETLQASFQMADSVVLILQKNCDISQLPQILDQVNQQNITNKKFAIEIELMHIDRKFNLALIFIGAIANVKKEEVVDYYTKKIYDSTNIQNQTFYNKLHLLIIHLIHTSKIKGVSQLIEDCERKNLQQKIRKTLFQEFYDKINDKGEGKIRSSGCLPLEDEGVNIGYPDRSLKQLLCDINEILYINGGIKQQHQNAKSPTSIQDNDGYQSSFSYGNNKFDFDTHHKPALQPKKNPKYNQSMQEQTTESSNNFGVQKSGIAASKLKGFSKNANGGSKRVEINNTQSKGRKGSESNNNVNNASPNQNNLSDYGNSYQANQENDYITSLDNDDDFENSIPKIYTCSYGTNTLLDSESSYNNSLRPQFSNEGYFNGSTDIYQDQEFRNSIMNNGSNIYNRPIDKRTNSATGGIGMNREQYIASGSLPNGSVKGQILNNIGKNQKNNGSKQNLNIEEQRSYSRQNYLKLQQQLQEDEEDGDFCWEQQEEDNLNLNKQQNDQPSKIKKTVNTYQHNQDLDYSYKKKSIYTEPSSYQ